MKKYSYSLVTRNSKRNTQKYHKTNGQNEVRKLQEVLVIIENLD